MPPPTTPSARRFVPTQRRPQHQSSIKKTSVAAPQDQAHSSEPQIKKSASLRGDAQDQFATAPRFQRRPPSRHSSSSDSPLLRHDHKSLATSKQHEQHEKTLNATAANPEGEDRDNEVMLLDQAVATNQLDQSTTDLLLSPKRRFEQDNDDSQRSVERRTKASTSFNRSMSTSSVFQSTHQSQPPRRRLTQFTTSVSRSSQSTTLSRSAFLAPSTTAQDDAIAIPLPEAFSPHRRGPKYVPGGMAATLQQLVLEAGQSALQTRRAQIKGVEETFLMELSVSEILSQSNDRLTMIAGGLDDGRVVNVLLIRDGLTGERGSASRENNIRRGQLLGLREPCFTVQACDKQWEVCVDWKVIGP